MAKAGRPTKFTKALALKICQRIALGESLRTVCRDEKMPTTSTVMLWALEDRSGFSEQYETARKMQAGVMFDELLDIADDGENDFYTRTSQDGSEYEVPDHEHINRSRLRVDTRKWYLSKVLPKIYGDKLDLTSLGEKLPTGYEQLKDGDLDKEIERLARLKDQARLRPSRKGAAKSIRSS